METPKLFRKAHEVLKQLVQFSALMFLIAQILAVIVFPLIEVSLRELKGIPGYVTAIVYILHTAIGAYAFAGLYKLREFIRLASLDKLEQEILEKTKTLELEQQKVIQLSSRVEMLTRRTEVVRAALHMLYDVLRGEDSRPADDVARLLSPLIQQRSEALGFNSEDLYNFVVYLYDHEAQLLRLHFRDCDNRISRRDRSWPVGVGHIGHAFAYKKTIAANMTDEVRVFGDGECSTDARFYASFIATPILDEQDPTIAIGVFAITSSRDDHLGRDQELIAETFSVILSAYSRLARDKNNPSIWHKA